MINHPSRKLGRNPSPFDCRTFKLGNYIKQLPASPVNVDWTKAVPNYGMLLNDKMGNCVIAGGYHLRMTWQANTGAAIETPTDAEVIQTYSDVGGFDPNNPEATDNGCSLLDFLNYWRQTGLQVQGKRHQIKAFAAVNLKRPYEVSSALWMFGGLLAGFALPANVQNATSWTVSPEYPNGDAAPGSWGGHCAPLAGDGPTGFKPITWGGTLIASGSFVADYCDEAYVVISEDWYEQNGRAPSGFDIEQLEADLAAL